MKFNYFSRTVLGLKRTTNEDSIGNIIKSDKHNINLRIICDGMGGHVGGAKASHIAVESIKEYFLNKPNSIPKKALEESIKFANHQIYTFAKAEPKYSGMGSTCTVLLETDGLIYVGHVGDSRAYIHTDQKIYRLTKDHSYVQELVDKGQITEQQMYIHPKKNQLTRALGVASEVEIQVVKKPILSKPGDFFLLCSDGLTGLVNDSMINSILNNKDKLNKKVNDLIKLAEKAGGYDNISVDLIKVIESNHIKTKFVNKNSIISDDQLYNDRIFDNLKKNNFFNKIKNKVFNSKMSFFKTIFLSICIVFTILFFLNLIFKENKAYSFSDNNKFKSLSSLNSNFKISNQVRKQRTTVTYDFSCLYNDRDIGSKEIYNFGEITRNTQNVFFDAINISASDEQNYGRKIRNSLRDKYRFIEKGYEFENLNSILKNLVSRLARPRGFDYQIYYIDEPIRNAFTAGGQIFFFKGMYDFCKTDSEIASIISHEIAHNELGHLTLNLKKEKVASNWGILGNIFLEFEKFTTQGFNQKQEIEADLFGMDLIYPTAYKNCDAKTLWKRMSQFERKSNVFDNFLRSHPYSKNRSRCITNHLDSNYNIYCN